MACGTLNIRYTRRIKCDRGGFVAATRYRPGRRRAGVACHREQTASRPIGREIKSGKSGVGTFLAVAGDIRIDQTRIPFRDVFILQSQLLSRRMWSVDDEHVSPLDQLLENFPSFRLFKVECEAALVAVSQLKGIRLFRIWLRRDLLPYSPQLPLPRLHLDHVSAEIRQDDGGARARR